MKFLETIASVLSGKKLHSRKRLAAQRILSAAIEQLEKRQLLAVTLPVTIGDFVWNDSNGNGIQDSGEAGINGVTLTLTGTSSTGTAVTDHKTTSGNGGYLFTEQPGTYSVTVDSSNSTSGGALADYTATPTLQGADRSVDSNANPSGTSPATLPSGSSDLTVDFGYYKPVTIGDFVWNDSNGNGIQETGEPGIPGVTLTLTGTDGAGNPVSATTTTDVNGLYQFTEPPGTYSVAVTTPAGYVPTITGQGTAATDSNPSPSGTSPGTLLGGGSDQSIDFGFYQPVTIGNFVWNDLNGNGVQDSGEPGIPGVTLTLTGTSGSGASITQTTTTDANGLYQFTEPPGTYTVAVTTPAGYVPTVTGQGTTATDSNLTPSGTTPGTLASGGSDQTIDFGFYQPVTIGDFVWNDLNGNGIQDSGEPGIPGVTLTLTGTDGTGNTVSATTTTDANGLYQFSEPPGTYTIAVTVPSGYVPTIAGQGTTATDSNPNPSGTTPGALPSGGSDQTIDFGFYQPITIGNFVWNDLNGNGIQDAGEPGIAGVSLTLTGTTGSGASITQTTTTDANGLYQFTEPPGTYTVSVTTPAGYTPTVTGKGTTATDSNPSPSGTTPGALPSGGSDQTIDFGFYLPAAIGDYTWIDTNLNGQQDASEQPLPGVTVTLSGTTGAGASVSATATTDASGLYHFTGLAPGAYSVSFTAPSGYILTTANNGDDASDSDATPAGAVSGTTGSYTLVSGQTDNTVDAGFHLSNPGIAFTKDASPTIAKPYQPVTYTYSVVNTGGIPIAGSDVHILDNNGTPTIPADDFVPSPVLSGGFNSGDANMNNMLDPTETWFYTASLIPPVTTYAVVNGTNVTAGVVIITQVLANGNVRATYLQDFAINDNTYGTGAIGWGSTGHKFGDLTGSDHLEFRFFDGNGNVAIDFYVDTITAASAALRSNGTTLRTYPAGYGTLGPFGGDGFMVSGSGANVVDYSTSITTNLNNPLNVPNKAALIVNSPTSLIGGNVVVDTTKAPGGWDYINSYTVEVSAAAFAAGGFGSLAIPDQHNSPSKLGVNQITTLPKDSTVTNTATATCTVPGFPTLTASDTASVAIVATPSSLAGTVYVDANNNGIRDSGEVGIGGVVITLNGTGTPVPVSKTTVTAADGTYLFDTLPAGTYTLTEPAQPSGYTDGTDKAGTSGGTAGNDVITGIALASNTNATGYSFGERLATQGSIAGSVYNDADNNGTKGTGEAGITNVTVKLYDSSSHQVVATALTSTTGAYSFTGLKPGSIYSVVEVQPSTYLDGRDSLGSGISGVTVTNDQFSNILIPAGGSDGIGYNFGEILAAAVATTSVSKAFTNTAIAPGNTLWLSSIYKMGGLSTSGAGDVHLRMVSSSITITTKAGVVYTIPVPNALITFTSSVTATGATTTYDPTTNTWKTTVAKSITGNTFLSAVPWVVPAGVTDLAGATLKWTGTFLDDSAAIDVSSWAGAAAVYNTTTQPAFPSNFNSLGVKPLDSATTLYSNADKAGTPELVKTQLIAGAMGTGGTAYIGAYTANANPTDINVIPGLAVDDSTESFLRTPVDPVFA